MALLLAGAVARWRRPRGLPGATVAEVAPLAAVAADVPDHPMAALSTALAAASTKLWAGALGVTPERGSVPPEHEAILAAARAALEASPLAERHFPRRPMLMPQLLAAVNDPNAPPLRLAAIIAQDPVLTGNILRLANSVFFRLSATPVESIQRAVVVCGTDGLQSLAATALVQPVFRGGSEAHNRFPAVLWERCTRASAAAEICARHWCPSDRQAAQLLALLSALGPLVAYRVVQDQYKAHPALPAAPAAFLQVIDRYALPLAARIAGLWQTPQRMLAVLRGEAQPESAERDTASPLERALRAGELLATLSLLNEAGRLTEGDCGAQALEAGIPMPLYASAWARFHPQADEGSAATHVA